MQHTILGEVAALSLSMRAIVLICSGCDAHGASYGLATSYDLR
jgi:hypothetical protein